jgi:hypothetical protein
MNCATRNGWHSSAFVMNAHARVSRSDMLESLSLLNSSQWFLLAPIEP